MANPKYADLPGIAYDQPDLYETDELPESDQIVTEASVDQSDSVSTLTISATDAYDKFKGCLVDASSVDFTEGISTPRKKGYNVLSGEWEMAGDKEPENVQQKYQRLQFEVKELLNEVEALKTGAQQGDQSLSTLANPTCLLEQAHLVQKMLLGLDLDRTLGSDTLLSLTDPQGALRKTLESQLERLRQGPAPATPAAPQKAAAEPALDPVQATVKIASLEERLKKLENLVGTDSQRLSMLTSHTDSSCLMEVSQLLSSRLYLLEAPHLDQVEARLSLLQQKMTQVAEKKSALEELDKAGKVNELYELLKRSDAMGSSLTQVVERLVCLQELHEQALQFSKAVSQLDQVQQHLSLALKNNDKHLTEVQTNFGQNIETINKNMTLLEGKIAALKK
ncbi:dynactin subunit 2 [Ixodes scapularis]|uniref:dynactin subunit 2 n=1 Tax=Ixodes scapularis TaxID=6945 RepID=UPI001A9CC1B7|nr:dynactin subunit 2 [Ixodes scapularis]